MSRKKSGSLKFGEIVDLSPVAVDEEEAKLVKRKRFGVKPMDIDEAILQMELVGHNFFVYQDVDSNKINVIYKRKDGDYGLLDPEYK
ncbi:SigL modulation protein [Clostridioides difficile]|nr:SigL modulation protein [Clostridioides difficile]